MIPVWKETLCHECGIEFTEEEWDVRHDSPDGEDIHEDCCPCMYPPSDEEFL